MNALPRAAGDILTLPSSSQPLVSVLIVTERNPHYLEGCLRSLVARLPPPEEVPLEIVLALNAARPEVRSLVEQRVRGATVVESVVRLGFAGGVNLARSVARGRFLALLHDDTEIESGWLEGLLLAINEEPAAGAVGSLVLNMDGTVQTAGRILWRNGGTSPVWPVGSPGETPPSPDHFRTRRAVDYTSSSSLLLDAASFDAMGGADERLFPAIYVDTALALGLRQLGRATYLEPRSMVRHQWHGTTGGPSGLRHFVAERNRNLLFERWPTELATFEEPLPGDPEAVARSLRRAIDWAAALPAPRESAPRRVAAPLLDRENQAREALRREAELQRDWALELERALTEDRGHLAALSAEREALRAGTAQVRAELAEVHRALAAITGTRWWRLYERFLPVLRSVRRLLPSGRPTSRAVSSRRE